MSSMDWRSIKKELCNQGWTLSRNANGHCKAVPPDRSKPFVVFSESTDPRSVRNSICDLRKSGFVWNERDPRSERVLKRVPSEPPTFETSPQLQYQPRSEMMTADAAFTKLREAKEYYDLSTQQERELLDELGRLRTKVEQASADRRHAGQNLREAKSAFDNVFSVDVPETGAMAAE